MTQDSFPQTAVSWQTAIQSGIGVSVEAGQAAWAVGQFPYDALQDWIKSTYADGFHPNFVPALLRNVHGLVAWVYGNGGEPYWPGSDAERLAYQQSLPKKRMGAGCLLFDENGRLLLVQPNYKPTWEIPGGVVEADESPLACCRRELLEELGVDRPIGRLLLVDYNSPTDIKTESLMFIFDGGTLTPAQIEQLVPCADELLGFAFFTSDGLPSELTSSLRRRILAAWAQREQPTNSYHNNQDNPLDAEV